MISQRTLSSKIKITGIGIHSGQRVTMNLHPAPHDHGIVFQRIDIENSPKIKVNAQNVGATENNTAIGSGPGAIHTVEHLLSAFLGLGIDNVFIDIDGLEVPIMDGSSTSFIFLFMESGLVNLQIPKKFMVIKKKVRVEVGDKWAEINPCDQLIIHSSISFPHPLIKTQNFHFEFTCQNYINLISRARTFGFLRDVDYLKRRGLAKGGSLNNAVVLDDFKVMNEEGLRFTDEFVRHKILDILGDFSLLGYDLLGKITTYKSGHNVHNLLCRKILESEENYSIESSAQFKKDQLNWFQLPHFPMANYINDI